MLQWQKWNDLECSGSGWWQTQGAILNSKLKTEFSKFPILPNYKFFKINLDI